MDKWHTMKVEDIIKNLQTSEKGLKKAEAKLRLQKYGLNVLVSKKRREALTIFFEQFKSILVLLLVVAAFVSAFLGEQTNAVAIGAIVVLNAYLGFRQDYKAEKAIEALKKLVVSKVVVEREGEKIELDASELVPGDMVLLEDGNRIPADIRLIEVLNLRIDEASLTGESTPVEKETDVLKDVPVADRKNMTFMGTLVSYGRGKGVVVSTGMSTEIGRIAKLVEEREEPTPLQEKLEYFGKFIGKAVIVIAIIIFLLGILRSGNISDVSALNLYFLTSVSLAVAAIPEGLPAVATLTLAIATQRMLKKNSAVKRLASVEALGDVTVICADKTGTMTSNEMTIRKIWASGKIIDVTGSGFEPIGDFLYNGKKIDPKIEASLEMLIKIGSICNDSILKKDKSWYIIGDPTEGALKVLASKAGIKEDYPRINEIPFSSNTKRMTTVNKVRGETIAYMKGAPEIMLKLCDKIYINKRLTESDREKILEVTEKMASQGLRVLGFAYKEVQGKYSIENVEKGLTFVGLAGMIDPPKKETKTAIKLCQQAGIDIIMITGDHKLTAEAVAKEIGFTGKAVTGEEIDKMTEAELEKSVEEDKIFARVTPEHKLRIVSILEKKGHIVAVTGDGTNDAPALKKATIGVAMGIKGTDVAKEASDMILLDDNFSTIVSAVREGRKVFDNIKKFVRYLIGANVGEVLLVASTFFFLPLDLLPILFPIQLLWINIVTDGFPALALGVEREEENIMRRKPRDPRESILFGSLPFLLAAGIIVSVSTFIAFLIGLQTSLSIARTMAFSTMVIIEVIYVLNCRSELKSVFTNNPFKNKQLLLSIIGAIIAQIIIVQTEVLDIIFETEPLNFIQWSFVLGLALLGLFIIPRIFLRKTFKSFDYTKTRIH